VRGGGGRRRPDAIPPGRAAAPALSLTRLAARVPLAACLACASCAVCVAERWRRKAEGGALKPPLFARKKGALPRGGPRGGTLTQHRTRASQPGEQQPSPAQPRPAHTPVFLGASVARAETARPAPEGEARRVSQAGGARADAALRAAASRPTPAARRRRLPAAHRRPPPPAHSHTQQTGARRPRAPRAPRLAAMGKQPAKTPAKDKAAPGVAKEALKIKVPTPRPPFAAEAVAAELSEIYGRKAQIEVQLAEVERQARARARPAAAAPRRTLRLPLPSAPCFAARAAARRSPSSKETPAAARRADLRPGDQILRHGEPRVQRAEGCARARERERERERDCGRRCKEHKSGGRGREGCSAAAAAPAARERGRRR